MNPVHAESPAPLSVATIRRRWEKFQKQLELQGMTVMIDGLASAVWPEDVQRLHTGLRDALQLYDRVAGNIRADHGWTAADVKRLAEIRALVSKS